MVSSCVVPGCTRRFSKDSKILFHRFPIKNQSLCRKWLRAIHREDLREGNLKYVRICSLHFKDESYVVRESQKLKLKSEAVPCTALVTQNARRQRKRTIVTRSSQAEPEPNSSEDCDKNDQEINSSDENSEATELEVTEEEDDKMSESEQSEQENGVHFQVKEFRSMVPAQFTTSSGAGGSCYILVWNPENSTVTRVPTAAPPIAVSISPPAVEKVTMPSDMQGMENRIRELENQISNLVDNNTHLNQQVELLSESNKDLKKKLKTLQQNKRRLLKRLNTMEGMVHDWKDERKPFSFCSDDL